MPCWYAYPRASAGTPWLRGLVREWSGLGLGALLVFTLACGRDDPGARHAQIRTRGSDSMVLAAVAWAEAYRKVEPEMAVTVNGGGTGTGIAALIQGTAEIAHATRRLRETEAELARQQGFLPIVHLFGYDAPAIVVHQNNPIAGLTFGELAGIYGEEGRIGRWDELGIEVPGCPSGEIVRVGRQDSSGTYAYLRERILGPHEEYRLGAREMQGSEDVVRLVATTPCAIGYTGLAYAPPADVRMPCLARAEGEPCVAPSMLSAVDGSYPLARPLLAYVRDDAPEAVDRYLRWVLSDAGQCLLEEVGYAPVRPVACGSGTSAIQL